VLEVSQGEVWWADDRALLAERVTKLPPKNFAQVMSSIDVVLGR
jgi:hypothetical protein